MPVPVFCLLFYWVVSVSHPPPTSHTLYVWLNQIIDTQIQWLSDVIKDIKGCSGPPCLPSRPPSGWLSGGSSSEPHILCPAPPDAAEYNLPRTCQRAQGLRPGIIPCLVKDVFPILNIPGTLWAPTKYMLQEWAEIGFLPKRPCQTCPPASLTTRASCAASCTVTWLGNTLCGQVWAWWVGWM